MGPITPKKLLVFVLTLYLVMGVTFAVIFPLGEAPDEPGHFTYVRYVALEQKLPVLKPKYEENETVAAHHPPAYYVLVAALTSPFIDGNLRLYRNPLFDWGWKATHFIKGPEHSFPWRGDHLAWHVARFISLALGLVSLRIIYLAGRRLLGSEWAAVACVAYVGLNPQFIYLHSYVTNDVLATLAGTLLVFSALNFYHRPTVINALFSAIAISLAVLAKLTAVAMLPALILAFILSWRRLSARSRMQILAILISVPALLSGWWFVRNLKLYGDLTGLNMLRVTLARNYYESPLGISELIRLLRPMFEQTFKSSWGYFGWLTLPMLDWIFLAIFIAHVVAAAGIIMKLKGLLNKPEAWIIGLSWAGLLVSFLNYNRIANSSGWQGRFLFPAVSVVAVAFIAGWRYWLSKRDQVLSLLVTGAGTSLTIYALVALILPVYLPPQFLPADISLRNRIDIPFEGGLRLIGYELPLKKFKPGDSLKLTLYWKLDVPSSVAYRVKVTAYTFTGECVIPTAESFLFRRYPVPLWKHGMIVKDEYRLHIEEDVEQVTAPLTLFVLQGHNAQPVPRLDRPEGSRENKAEITWITVGTRRGPTDEPERKLEAVFGDEMIRLLGYTLHGEPVRAGGTITVTLYWKAEKPVEFNYHVFVHALNEKGELIAQHDSPPRSGLYPTSVWSPKEIIVDSHPLTVPQDYEGKIKLLVGLYSLETMERLKVRSKEGVELLDRAVPLGEVY
ncbi:MAG: glycosyltransferase family 39 protein [Anaerolineae bacterium]|nr:glycosyltransferase family 39 protein [Anaerolineae bacterium]MDW8101582.1 glycosyltransferase family 39 protein [Anaerolineae bacterium]